MSRKLEKLIEAGYLEEAVERSLIIEFGSQEAAQAIMSFIDIYVAYYADNGMIELADEEVVDEMYNEIYGDDDEDDE